MTAPLIIGALIVAALVGYMVLKPPPATGLEDPDAGAMPDLRIFPGIEYATPTGIVKSEDVTLAIIDEDPEASGSYDTQPDWAGYLAHFTSAPPDDAFEILGEKLQKKAGGTDEIMVKYPDGSGTRIKRRDRGGHWPNNWKGRYFFLDWRHFSQSSPAFIYGSTASMIRGQELPFLVCRARSDTRGQKMIEIVRIGKAFKRWEDVGEVYWIPGVIRAFQILIDICLPGVGAVIAKGMNNMCTAAYRGQIANWRQAVRHVSRTALSVAQQSGIINELGVQLSPEARVLVDRAVAMPSTVSQYGHIAARMTGLRWDALRAVNKGTERSPSRIALAKVYT